MTFISLPITKEHQEESNKMIDEHVENIQQEEEKEEEHKMVDDEQVQKEIQQIQEQPILGNNASFMELLNAATGALEQDETTSPKPNLSFEERVYHKNW
eukprot:CAMPEP_0117421752 /NCGR_PEP_ID=MMETSP0758-20121206/2745_1 /TAXON_ID=63605 /ORGANISM="Percolomonas cosmopolitus, Strain AE-1 (ATCC 50343)" /LENGTH=98 /DNA_ID=CAMNT_0005203993 /DNA_START=157 /DNA_END=450 /DNA_ORIENTATION=-